MNTVKISTGVTEQDLIISDGREHFWQWDVGCTLTITGCPGINELHYYRVGMEKPMTLDVYESEDKILCEVPDELLQTDGEFIVYACQIDNERRITVFSKNFRVTEKPKSEDYIYTPTEVKTVEGIVNDIISKMDIDIDLSGYEEKNNKILAEGEDLGAPYFSAKTTEEYVKTAIQTAILDSWAEVIKP